MKKLIKSAKSNFAFIAAILSGIVYAFVKYSAELNKLEHDELIRINEERKDITKQRKILSDEVKHMRKDSSAGKAAYVESLKAGDKDLVEKLKDNRRQFKRARKAIKKGESPYFEDGEEL